MFLYPVLLIIAHILLKVKEMKSIKMKICGIICEYNPFHNGHLYQLEQARALSGADAILCIMSGNFTQRGEAAILDKYVRAKHAVAAGADAVIELPTPFATSNAELFAKGAVKLLTSVPSLETLCFGAETADAESFWRAAKLLSNEPNSVSTEIKRLSKSGLSYARARAQAWSGQIDEALLSSPNNVLGIEYTKALLSYRPSVRILPILRKGSAYLDNDLQENYSSATAIRSAIASGILPKGNLPDFVLRDLPTKMENRLESLEKYALLAHSEKEIASVCDCTEGLENAFKRVAETDEPVSSLTNARYTGSRIRRIALQNLLNINETLIRESLQANLYLRVLAANKARSDVLSALAESPFPVLIRRRDEESLDEIASRCVKRDIFAEQVYALLSDTSKNERNIFY